MSEPSRPSPIDRTDVYDFNTALRRLNSIIASIDRERAAALFIAKRRGRLLAAADG